MGFCSELMGPITVVGFIGDMKELYPTSEWRRVLPVISWMLYDPSMNHGADIFTYMTGCFFGQMDRSIWNIWVRENPKNQMDGFRGTPTHQKKHIGLYWLVVEQTPLKNMKVNWDDYSQYMETLTMFQTTNQYSLGKESINGCL